MNDERISLEHRIAWLEFKMVRLLWAAIGAVSLLAGGIAYNMTVDHVGGWGAVGVAVAAWAIVGWYLKRAEFKGAPAHIEYIDP